MIACDVLTGFLGSGKSTLLNAFLRAPQGAGSAVVVNEFGAIGIDQLVFQQVAENVVLLDSGCLCCSVTNTLAETLLDLRRIGQSGLRRVVIETSGMADPLPILHSLLGDRALTPYFRLGQVITTIDAMQGQDQLTRHPEAARQAALADYLVITKTDLVEFSAEFSTLLARLNPAARVCESASDSAALQAFAGEAGARTPRLVPVSGAAHHRGIVGSWSAYIDIAPTWAGVSAWWNLLLHQEGVGLLRVKGLLRLSDPEAITLIQGVGKVFHSPQMLAGWPDHSDPRSRLVCIGEHLDGAWLSQSLRALAITEPSYRPLTLQELEDCF